MDQNEATVANVEAVVWKKGKIKSCSKQDEWYGRKIGEVMKFAQSADDGCWMTKQGKLVLKCDVEFTAATASNPVSEISSNVVNFLRGTRVTDIESNVTGTVTLNENGEVHVWFDKYMGSGTYCFDTASPAYSGNKLELIKKNEVKKDEHAQT